MTLKGRFRGTILWLAIGDALGAPFEFKPVEETRKTLNRLIGKQGLLNACADLLEVRSWTDDTQLSICHIRSLIRSGKFCPQDTAKEFAENALKRQGSGSCTREAVANLKKGVPWDEAGRNDPALAGGNGPAMKVAPLALFYHHDLTTLYDVCREASMITHNCPEAFAGSRAIAFVIAKAIKNELDNTKIIDQTVSFIGASETSDRLLLAKDLLARNIPSEESLAEIGTGGYIAETVSAAIYCFLKYFTKPHTAILKAILAGKDTDTTASIVGALHGAHTGIAKVPSAWYSKLEGSKELSALSYRLFDAWHNMTSLAKV